MKKIKTLFKRVIEDHVILEVLPEVTPGCEWVFNEKVIPTRKVDGQACAIIGGKLYTRLDFKSKKDKVLPDGAIPCQESPDEITGSFPHWIPVLKDGYTVLHVDNVAAMMLSKSFQYIVEAFLKLVQETQPKELLELDGTYEICGPKFQGNPEHLDTNALLKHGSIVLEDFKDFSYNGVKSYLETHNLEGIVFYRANGDMAKIKRSDFGLDWGCHQDRGKLKGKKVRK